MIDLASSLSSATGFHARAEARAQPLVGPMLGLPAGNSFVGPYAAAGQHCFGYLWTALLRLPEPIIRSVLPNGRTQVCRLANQVAVLPGGREETMAGGL